MRNRKWTLFQFSTGDFKAVERYLNEQAEKGWELKTLGVFLARWHKTDRKDLRWCVDLANPKENNDRETRKEYVDLCAEGGWELFSLRGNMYLFKSMPGRNPPPVQTDPELERKNYNKYYVRSTILSVVYVLAMLTLYALMFFSMNRNLDYAIQSTRLEWHQHWLAVGAMAAAPLWGIWALWRVADFIRAMISNRGGGIGTPSRWVMWVNCVVSVLGGLGALSFLLGLALEGVIQAELAISVFVFPAVWAIGLFARLFMLEFEMYRGERRLILKIGLIVLVLFAAMVAGRVAAPYGEWSTNRFDPLRDYNGALAQYALLEEVPVVRGEDLGIPLGGAQKTDYLDLAHEYTPVGERWEVEYTFWSPRLSRIRCETYACPFLWQANLTERQMVAEMRWWSEYLNRESVSSSLLLAAPPQVDMEPVELTWADSAWYGENENASVLVVRVGTQVTHLYAPQPLLTEELLPMLEDRLAG